MRNINLQTGQTTVQNGIDPSGRWHPRGTWQQTIGPIALAWYVGSVWDDRPCPAHKHVAWPLRHQATSIVQVLRVRSKAIRVHPADATSHPHPLKLRVRQASVLGPVPFKPISLVLTRSGHCLCSRLGLYNNLLIWWSIRYYSMSWCRCGLNQRLARCT